MREPSSCGDDLEDDDLEDDDWEYGGSLQHDGLEAPAELVEIFRLVVEVGPYIGATAVGGIIGNRADAGTVAMATRMFRSVRERWRRRRVAEDEPLSRDEAVEAATAAAITQGYVPDSLAAVTAERDEAGMWVVILRASHERSEEWDRLRVRVPPGDLAEATIFVVPS
ncbi:hypothetical protein DMH08_27730 [Actinomadura sp. WAC 06369]|nr:hypothetical protein DMH08_27730 [Actinomadura sp. WAC 06369]